MINSDEIQVIAASSAAPVTSDDARTVVYSGSKKAPKIAKSTTKSARPAPGLAEPTVTIPKPARLPKIDGLSDRTNLRGLVRPVRDDECTMLRPMSNPPPKPTRSSPTNLSTPYAPSPTPFAMAANDPRAAAHDSIRPMTIAKDADSLPLGTVISQRMLGVRKPGMSWAAALMAVGVFLGLVTAVIARGDADALIEATASFVDPSHPAARPSGGQAVQAAAGAALLPIAIPKREVPVIQVTPPEPPPAVPVSAPPAPPVVAAPIVTPPPSMAIGSGSRSKSTATLHTSHAKLAAAATKPPASSAAPAPTGDRPEGPTANGLTRRADEELEGVMRAIGH